MPELLGQHSGMDLAARLRLRAESPVAWQQPEHLELEEPEGRQQAEKLLGDPGVKVFDPSRYFAAELYDQTHPRSARDENSREAFISQYVNENSVTTQSNGNWFHFPGDRSVGYYPSQENLQGLLTARNRDLITETEQARLLSPDTATLALFGLSIGSNIARECRRAGIGGAFLLADPDVVAPTNLNRLDADVRDIGAPKVDVAATKISVLNPYLKLQLLRQGLTSDTIDSLSTFSVTLAFDEMDDFGAKAQLRSAARRLGIPVLMAADIGDRVQLDVERHDLGPVEPFNGRISARDVLKLEDGHLTPKERKAIMKRLVGIRNMSTRMIESTMRVGDTLSGLPQLGTTASMSGVVSALAARELILGGDKLKSGRYVVAPRRNLRLGPQVSLRDAVRVYRTIPAYMRQQTAPM